MNLASLRNSSMPVVNLSMDQKKVAWIFAFTSPACNIARLRTLLAASPT